MTDDREPANHKWSDLAQLADAPVARREHFIPIRKRTLIELILADESLESSDRSELSSICQRLDALIHLQFHSILDDLKEAFPVSIEVQKDESGSTFVLN